MGHGMETTHRRTGFLAAAVLLLGCLMAPTGAFAAGEPALSPTTIVSDGFEPGAASRFVLDWPAPSPGDPSPAYWGPIAQLKHSGLASLWCAGSIPDQTTTTAWTTFSGRYPDYTAGLATLALPELSGYYSASLDYWYRMPTIGSNDGGSFNVLWSTAIGADVWDYHNSWPTAADWTHAHFDLTVPTPAGQSRPVDLSRTPGKIRFIFIDDVSAYESPTNGEGPAIDDVVVAGYKFGPVRDLNASVGPGGGVRVTWTPPARSVAPSAPDEDRPLAYRVWRAPNTAPYAWTELTDARITATSFDDADPLVGGSRYLVQAWDPADGVGFGEVQVPTGTALVVVGERPPAPVSDISITGGTLSGGVYTAAPAITVSRNVAGTTYWRWDAGDFAPVSATSFQVPVSAGTHTLTVYSVNEVDVAETPFLTRTVTLNVPPVPTPPPAPTRPGLSRPWTSSKSPVHRKSFYIRGYVTPAHASATTVLVRIYRKVGSHYHYLRTHTVRIAAGATYYSLKTSLTSHGWYRVRTYHADASHLATYSSYRSFKVR